MERHWIVVDCRRPGNQLVHASERTFLLLALPVAAASCVSGEEQAKEGGPHLRQRFISFFFFFYIPLSLLLYPELLLTRASKWRLNSKKKKKK